MKKKNGAEVTLGAVELAARSVKNARYREINLLNREAARASALHHRQRRGGDIQQQARPQAR
jgi:hypothetical protein